jgi:hypothetical protein
MEIKEYGTGNLYFQPEGAEEVLMEMQVLMVALAGLAAKAVLVVVVEVEERELRLVEPEGKVGLDSC